jgi:hypothetical protein
MTDPKAAFTDAVRREIAALLAKLARQLFRRDARNAAVRACVDAIVAAADTYAEARIGAHDNAPFRAAVFDAGLRVPDLERELAAERAECTRLRGELAQDAPKPRPRKPRTSPALAPQGPESHAKTRTPRKPPPGAPATPGAAETRTAP